MRVLEIIKNLLLSLIGRYKRRDLSNAELHRRGP